MSIDICRGEVREEALPLVSIVTPTFNQADYLAETINSVLAQDYPNIEYIVLDDGSTDETVNVLKQFDGRIQWESHANIGQARTLNKGWSICKGKIIGYLSSDDMLAPNAVSEAVRALLNNPNIILTYPDYFLINERSVVIRKFQAPDYNRKEMIERLICHPGPGAFFRRDIFDRLGGWNANLRQIPDVDYWLKISGYGNFKRLSLPLAYSRIHASSLSFSKPNVERSGEPVHVIKRFWEENDEKSVGASKRISLANAHLLTARMHLIAGRFAMAVEALGFAIRYKRSLVMMPRFWRIIFVAMLRTAYYSSLKK